MNLRHEMVVANAGSGKTHFLTTRAIALLAAGAKPDRLVALTFTKMAAGEFLDAVFLRLAGAVQDPEKLEALRKMLAEAGLEAEVCRGLDASACVGLLHRLVFHMGSLSMGTIDSFFGRIVRAFPFECGLSGEFSILGDAESVSAREETLAGLFESRAVDADGFQLFVDLVRRQSRRTGERDVFRTLLKVVESTHRLLLDTPDDVEWGNPKTIWGTAFQAGDLAEAARAFGEAVTSTQPGLSEEATNLLQVVLEGFAVLRPGDTLPDAVENFRKSKLFPELHRPFLQMTKKKTGWIELNAKVSAARIALRRAYVKVVLDDLLARTAALHRLMQAFEEIYDLHVRRAGQLTFEDVTRALAVRADSPDWLAAVGYRLDQRFDHWLLDEFQDTSRTQWRVLGSLVDEAVQDAGERRSFFYVGDTKQALYLWRGGDPRLFFEIFDYYNRHAPGHILERSLAESHRSARPVLDAVNAVFGDTGKIAAALSYPAAALDAWKRAWIDHSAAPRIGGLRGWVEWIDAGQSRTESDHDDEGDEIPSAGPQDLKVLEILESIQPWRRGLTCALLKRKNRDLTVLADLLRSHGIPVTIEGKANPCLDNPLGAALLAGFRAIAFPSDTFSRVIFLGFPLAKTCVQEGFAAFRISALASLARQGFAATIREWIAGVDLSQDSFLTSRAGALVEAAADFDAARKPSDGIAGFIRFIESRTTREGDSGGAVRILTVHQAKGLTFDMVILSGMDQMTLSSGGESLELGGGSPPRWGLIFPNKDTALSDPILAENLEARQADNAYGSLCTAYVAMSRPRLALYILAKSPAESSAAKSFGRLLRDTLTKNQDGDSDWFTAFPIAEPAEQSAFHAEGVPLPPPRGGTPHPLSPSSNGTRARQFTLSRSGAASLGSEVHALLAGIEWMDDSDPPDFQGGSIEAQALVKAWIGRAGARGIFTRPSTPALLWREQAFDLILDGRWISGIFDRVRVDLSPDGQPVRASVFDFKTGTASREEIALRHSEQMDFYRAAAAHILGLDESAVTATTVQVQ